jgi:type IV fimbrial biogenesis protein FimT
MPTLDALVLHPPRVPAPGLSSIELAVVLAIVAVLAGLALPGFATLVERHRLRAATQDIASAIYLARAEALRRGGEVVLRRNETPSCAGRDAADWSCGWRVAAAPPDAASADEGAPGRPERMLQVWPAPEGVEVRMHLAQASAALWLNRWGRFVQSQGFSVRLRTAGSSGKQSAQVVCVSSGGRLRMLDGSDTC